MQRCVIVGGAEIRNYDFIREQLRSDDYFIFCDCGLAHMEPLGVCPSLIVGDFDSHAAPDTEVETIVLPCEKDDTDTVFAAKEAIRRGFSSFLLIGVTGGRLDHTIGNLSILLMLHEKGMDAVIADDYSSMQIAAQEPVLIQDDCEYFSLLNISGLAEGITIRNAKYPLRDAEITCTYQYGVSNEVIPGKTASVSVGNGKLLLIRVFRNSL